MNPIELKEKLFKESNSERKYKRGIVDDRTFPKLKVDNIEVINFSYKDIALENNGIPFLVRRHSRYRDYPLHIHDWIEISYVYSGKCVQVIDGVSYNMQKGQLLLMGPGCVHTIEKLDEDDILVQIAVGQDYLTSNFFNRLSSSSIISHFFINAFNTKKDINNFYLFDSSNSRRLFLFIEEFLCEYYDPSIANIDILNNLFSLIVSELVNILYVTSNKDEIGNDYVLKILHYIENNYRDCNLSTVASVFSLNPNYMSNLLKKHTGYSFNELLIIQKLSIAEKLLKNSNASIIDIANYVGYSNISFFYKKFKQRYGVLPGEYRDGNAK